MLIVEKTKLDGVLLVKPGIFRDFRGTYTETYNKKQYQEMGIPVEFVVDDYSTSKKGVLRGLHGDQKTWKLVSCKLGALYQVVLNFDPTSPQFGQWVSFELTEENCWQVLIPPKFANGHYALADKIIFNYKQSQYYDPKVKDGGQFTVRYNDPKFNVVWPFNGEEPILSERDKNAPLQS